MAVFVESEPGDPVLITGSRAPCAVVLARALHKAGFRIYTADSLRPNLSQGTQAITADFLLPSPRFHPVDCAQELRRLLRQHHIGALIPTCEEVYSLSVEQSRLPVSTKCCFPSIEILDRLHHKFRCMEMAESLGIKVPRTRLIQSQGELELLDWNQDAVLKRVYSRFSGHVVLLIGSPDERRKTAGRVELSTGIPWIHQEYIPGRQVCSYSLARNGVILYHVAYTTPYTVGTGAGVFYESVNGRDSLEVARKLAEAVGFTGQISLDFMENSRGLWLLECNPRATMGLALVAERPDFASAWRRFLEAAPSSENRRPGPDLPEPDRQEDFSTIVAPPGLRCQMSLAMLFYGWRQRAKGRSWRRWLYDLVSTRDALGASPRWLLIQLAVLANYGWRAKKLGIPVIQFTTYDIEWNGTARSRLERDGVRL